MATRPPLVLLPPSEGKAEGGTGPPWRTDRDRANALDRYRLEVLQALVSAMAAPEAKRAKLLGVKGVALAAATAANLAVLESPTGPAIDRYSGVLYEGLDVTSLTKAHRRRLDGQVFIFSGAFGFVRPAENIPNYKLKMGATLVATGKLSTFWRQPITESLAPIAAGRTIWNLLPNEHDAAWLPLNRAVRSAPRTIVTVRFVDEVQRKDGRELVAVAHWNKLLKGALVRHMLATQLADIEGLADFVHPRGYRFDPELTEQSPDGGRQIAYLVNRA